MTSGVHLRTMASGLLLVLNLVACTSPASRFYTLAATAETEKAAPLAASVAVDNVSLPATVDRPQWVLQVTPNRVQIDEFNRWAAPLSASMARIVAENLVVLLATPQVASGFITASLDPVYRVTIDVQRFDSIAGDSTVLEALWMVRRRGDTQPRMGRTVRREVVAGPGYDGLAAAHSRAIAVMSQDIAQAIRELARHPR